MRNRKILLTGVLFCSCVLFLAEASAAGESPSDVSLRPNIVEYKSGGLRDPFYQEKKPEPMIKKATEEVAKQKPLPQLKIQGIVWGSSLPQAIINNKVVRVGDKIEEASIVEIKKEGVIVLFEKQKYTLSSPASASPEGSFKKPEGGKNEK